MKVTLNGVGNLQDTTTAQNTLNTNNQTIETAFDNTLSRDGTQPNQMQSELDMNSHQIINLPLPATGSSPARLQDLVTANGGGVISNIPAGGVTNQGLVKTSNADYAYNWGNVVNSVGLTLPADFTVTNSPVTLTGNLTGAWAVAPTGTGAVVRATGATLTNPTFVNPNVNNLTQGFTTTVTAGTTTTLTVASTYYQQFTGGTTQTVILPAVSTLVLGTSYFVDNNSTNAVIVQSSGLNQIEIVAAGTHALFTCILTTGTTAASWNCYYQSASAANGKSLFSNNTLTFNGIDGTGITFQGGDTYIGRTTTDTLTNKTYDTAGAGNVFKVNGTQISAVTGTGSAVLATTPTLVTPVLGVATATSVNKVTLTAPATGATLTLADGTVLTETTSTSIGRGQYQATNTNDAATAGNIGEYVSSTVLLGSAVSLVSGTAKDITTISLTAGDWDVWGTVAFNPNAATTMSNNGGWVSTTANTAPTIPNNGAYAGQSFAFAAGTTIIFPVGQTRLSLSTTTTVSLGCFSVFAVNTNSAYGFIGARRVR